MVPSTSPLYLPPLPLPSLSPLSLSPLSLPSLSPLYLPPLPLPSLSPLSLSPLPPPSTSPLYLPPLPPPSTSPPSLSPLPPPSTSPLYLPSLSLSQERVGRFKRFGNLFYKFSPVLMRQCPMETVEAWKRMKRYLQPRKLIPALVQCNQPADRKQVWQLVGS